MLSRFHLEIIIPKGTKRTDFRRLPVFNLSKSIKTKATFYSFFLQKTNLLWVHFQKLAERKQCLKCTIWIVLTWSFPRPNVYLTVNFKCCMILQ